MVFWTTGAGVAAGARMNISFKPKQTEISRILLRCEYILAVGGVWSVKMGLAGFIMAVVEGMEYELTMSTPSLCSRETGASSVC
jgi:hypothetical protein